MSLLHEARIAIGKLQQRNRYNIQDENSKGLETYEYDPKSLLEYERDMQKRLGLQKDCPEVVPVLREFTRDRIEIMDSFNCWSRNIKAVGPSISAMIFRGDPALCRLLSAEKNLAPILEKLQELNLSYFIYDPASLNKLQEWSHMNYPVGQSFLSNGISLSDIDKLPLDPQHADENFKKIAAFYPPVFRITSSERERKERFIQHNVLILAAMKDAQPTRAIVVPDNIEGLQQHFRTFLDRYTNMFLEARQVDSWDQFKELLPLSWSPVLKFSVGCYLPARLGISPNSAVEVFKNWVLNSGIFNPSWNRFLHNLAAGSLEAWKVQNVNADLQEFVNYNLPASMAREKALEQMVNDKKLQSDQIVDHLKELPEFFYQIHTEILRSPLGRLNVYPDSRIFEEVQVTSFNRKSLVFIAQFTGQEAYLPVEINRNPFTNEFQVYGIPARIKTLNPGVEKMIISHLLPPVIDRLKQRRAVHSRDNTSSMPSSRPFRESRTTIPSSDGSVQGPKQPTVLYDERELRRRLKGVPEKVVLQIIEGLNSFQQGNKIMKPLKDNPGLSRLRFGDYRVVLEDLGNNKFVIVFAGDKQQINTNKKLSRVV